MKSTTKLLQGLFNSHSDSESNNDKCDVNSDGKDDRGDDFEASRDCNLESLEEVHVSDEQEQNVDDFCEQGQTGKGEDEKKVESMKVSSDSDSNLLDIENDDHNAGETVAPSPSSLTSLSPPLLASLLPASEQKEERVNEPSKVIPLQPQQKNYSSEKRESMAYNMTSTIEDLNQSQELQNIATTTKIITGTTSASPYALLICQRAAKLHRSKK